MPSILPKNEQKKFDYAWQKNFVKKFVLPIFRKDLITDQTIRQKNSSNKVTQKISAMRKMTIIRKKSDKTNLGS